MQTQSLERETPKPSRILWIDVFRIFAMLFIIAIHARIWNFGFNVVGFAFVQDFFVISALFMTKTDWPSNLRRSLTLLVPLLVWSLLYAWSNCATDLATVSSRQFIEMALTAFYHDCGFHLWFLAAMFLLVLAHPILSKIEFPYACGIILFSTSYALSSYAAGYYIFGIPIYPIALFIFALAFFLIGIQLRKFVGVQALTQWLEANRWRNAIIVIVVILLKFLLVKNLSDFGRCYHYFVSSFTLVPLSVLFVSLSKPISTCIVKLAPSIFFTYCSHWFVTEYWRIHHQFLEEKLSPVLFGAIEFLLPFIILIVGYLVFLLLRRNKLIAKYLLLQ